MTYIPENTPPGMAHFIGTGPDGITCATCKFFAGTKKRYRQRPAEVKPGRCRKFVAMIRAATGRRRVAVLKLDPETPSCRHYAPKGAKKPVEHEAA